LYTILFFVLYFGPRRLGFWVLYFGLSSIVLWVSKPIKRSGQQPLKEASKKVKNELKKAPYDTQSGRHMRASSPSFFCHLSTSHWEYL